MDTHLRAGRNYGSDGSVTNAERWEVRGQSDHAFTDRAYWFGAERYEDDRFSAFEFQASLSTGLGYKIVDTERTKFWVQGGPGHRFAEIRETGESEDGVILRGDMGLGRVEDRYSYHRRIDLRNQVSSAP